MKTFIKKNVLFVLLIIVILVSVVYRVKFFKLENEDSQGGKKGKTVVHMYIKSDADSYTRQYQAAKFNKTNKDNIYIDLKVYEDDYDNVIKTDLANKNEVDIFQYSYSDVFRYEHVLPLEKLGLDDANNDNLFYYNGKPYGVKVTGNNAELMWNKDIVKKAGINPDKMPQSYAELIEDLKKIKNYDSSLIPFEIPTSSYDNLRISVGLPSVNNDSIYTSFWNYKTGKYEFDSSKQILDKYNEMYSEGLLQRNLEMTDDDSIRKDFYNGKTAVIISTYKDRSYFSEVMPLSFEVNMENLPQVSNKSPKYYYVGAYDAFMVNKDTKNKAAAKEVMQWLMSKNNNQEIDETGRTLSTVISNPVIKNKMYSGYNDNSNYYNETYDPTLFIYYDRDVAKGLIYDAIEGKKSVNEVIKQLNSNFENYCNISKEQVNFDSDKYVESK